VLVKTAADDSGPFSRLVDAYVNCSTRGRVAPGRLAAILRSGRLRDRAAPQLAALFAEVPLDTLLGFVDEHGIPLEALARTYDAVKESYGEQNRELEDWLRYLEVTPPGDAAAGR
jgi:hypothetical protein